MSGRNRRPEKGRASLSTPINIRPPHPSWTYRSAEEDRHWRKRFVREPERMAEFWGLVDE